MRSAILLGWLCLPLAGWIYHEGPGQDLMKLDDVDGFVERADAAVAKKDWVAAIKNYNKALAALPAEHEQASRRIRLALNQARINTDLLKARSGLTELIDELEGDPNADASVLDAARKAQAASHYYITWLMRLEGYPRAEWEPEIDAARQNYRLLAERAEKCGATAQVSSSLEDLESAVKLARIDVEELQGIPLPSQ